MSSIERDAYRFVEAQLDYGKGAGTKRKLMKEELDYKFKDPNYKAAFDDAVSQIDRTAVMRKISQRKDFEKSVNMTMRGYRKVKRFGNFYYRNQSWFEPILRLIFGGGNGGYGKR